MMREGGVMRAAVAGRSVGDSGGFEDTMVKAIEEEEEEEEEKGGFIIRQRRGGGRAGGGHEGDYFKIVLLG